MASTPMAVRLAWLNDRARRMPEYMARRAQRARSRLTRSTARAADDASTPIARLKDDGDDAARRELIAHERAIWRSRLAPLVDECVPSHSEARGLLTSSRLFEPEWYLETCPDQSWLRSADEALDHYLEVGWKQGSAPNPWVDPAEISQRLGTTAWEPVSLLEALRPIVALPDIQAGLEGCRPAGVPRSDRELRWRDLVTGQLPPDPSFVLYRILGNDLPPRHEVGQSERNLRFLLEHEPDLPGCERRYVLNRVLDPDLEQRLLGMLEDHGSQVLHLPFDPDAYRNIGWRVSDFTKAGLLYGAPHEALPEVNRLRAVDHAFHDKNLYVMHNNGARNAALEQGRQHARWVLPFDGNCYFTASAWDEVRRAVTAAPQRRYLVVPMLRVNDNTELLTEEPPAAATEEPQVAFRADAPETFDATMRYGRRPKVELLRRLGVPGPWEGWPDEPWESPFRGPSAEAGEYQQAGWVARLASGRPTLEGDNRERMVSRMVGIRSVLVEADIGVLRARFRADEPAFLDVDTVSAQLATREVAGRSLQHLVGAEQARAGHPPAGCSDIQVRSLVAHAFPGLLLDDDVARHGAVERLRQLLADGRPLTSWQPWSIARTLDVVRLLAQHDAIPQELHEELAQRVREHRHALLDDDHCGDRRRAMDATGVWFEVEQVAVASYLDDAELILQSLQRSAGRFHDQFVLLPQRSARWRRRVERAQNLLAWGDLLRATAKWGITLTDRGSAAHERHRRVATALSQRVGLPTPLLLGPADLPPVRLVPQPDATTPLYWWAGVVEP